MIVCCDWCEAPAESRAVRDDGQAWAFCGRHSKKAIAAAGAIVRGKTTIAFHLVDPDVAPLVTAVAGIDVDLAYAIEGAASDNPLVVLEYLTAVVVAADRARQVAVDVARSRMVPWPVVGDVLGVTKQSAQARWGRRRAPVPAQPGATLLDVLAQDDSAGYGADAASGSRP